jgi:hypothetical protein
VCTCSHCTLCVNDVSGELNYKIIIHCCTTVLRWMHFSIIAFPKSYSTGNIFSFFSSEFFLWISNFLQLSFCLSWGNIFWELKKLSGTNGLGGETFFRSSFFSSFCEDWLCDNYCSQKRTLWWLLRPSNLQQMWQTLRNSGSQSFRNKLRQVLRSLPPTHFFTKHHSTCTSKSVLFIAFITFNHW